MRSRQRRCALAKPQGNLGSIIVPSNAVFAVVAYDEGDHVHAKTVWNSNYDHLCREDRERLFIAVQDATNEAMFKLIQRAKPRASDKGAEPQ